MCETSKQVARRNILQVIHFLALIDRFVVLFSTNKSLLLFVIILMLNQQMNIFFLNEGI